MSGQIQFLTLLAGLIMLSSLSSAGFDFSYDGEKGPEHWRGQFEKCAGKFQSPINIDEHLVQKIQFPRLEFQGFKARPFSTTILNNGHTVVLRLNTSQEATVSAGPLKNLKYVFSQLHFHWGANDSLGSEDLINNHSFPMELHMVMYKAEYGDPQKATQYSDGLAVLAFFFEIGEDDNPAYEELFQVLPLVILPDSQAHLQRLSSLDSLIGSNKLDYFTYHGSLTTPPCSEVVTWIDFKQPVLLSHAQLALFRQLRSHEGLMTHNHRPTQPLGGRLVWYNEHSSASHTTLNTGGLLLVLALSLKAWA